LPADPLRERLLKDELLQDVSADDLLIIATQDCDPVCHSFETEPYAAAGITSERLRAR
jgi:hypothetical protein